MSKYCIIEIAFNNMEVINNGYAFKKRNEKKQKNERRYKKFTINEYQLVKNDLYKLSLKPLFYKTFN